MAQNLARWEELADAGLRVLAAQGARGLTHRAVDREARVPQGTTSNYFGSRDALLGALGSRIFERLAPAPEVLGSVGRLPPTLEQATAYLQDIVARTTRHPELTLALFGLRLEAVRRPALAGILRATLERNYTLNTEFHLQAGLPGGAQEVALLHYAVDGLLLDLLTVSINGRHDPQGMVRELANRILGASRSRPPA